jgi:hypothetical protein
MLLNCINLGCQGASAALEESETASVVRQSLKGLLEFESIGDLAARSRATYIATGFERNIPVLRPMLKRVEGDDAAWVVEPSSNEIDEVRVPATC